MVSENFIWNLLWKPLISWNKKKIPNNREPEQPIIEEEEGEFNSIEGNIHEYQEKSNMDEKEEIRYIFLRNK